jgi:hypothetical protein
MLGLAILSLFVLLALLCAATIMRGWRGYSLVVLTIGLLGILLPFAPSKTALLVWYLFTVVSLLPMIWLGERGRAAFEKFFTDDVATYIKKFQEWNQ